MTPNLYGNLVANVVRALPELETVQCGLCSDFGAYGACAPARQAPRSPGLP